MTPPSESIPVRCQKCGLMVKVPSGGKRLCSCGNWVAAAEGPPAALFAEPEPVLAVPQLVRYYSNSDFWPPFDVPITLSNSSSVSTGTPSSFALASLLPAFSPAIR